MNSPRRIRRLLSGIGAVIVMGAMTAACQGKGSNNNPPPAGTSAASTSSAGATAQPAPTSVHPAQSPAAPVGSAVVLPFTGLDRPTGVSVDSDGAIYVTDTNHNRVVKLPANSESQTVLPATDLNKPQGLTAVSRDEVSVTDATTNRVLWSQAPTTSPTAPWKATSTTEWVGPFSGLKVPRGVVSLNDIFYVVDSGNNRVVKWAPGSNSSDVVAFTGLNNPDGLAIVNTGLPTLYVADTANNQVLSLVDGSNVAQTVLALTGLSNPHGVAVYDPKAVYVTDTGNNRVVKLATDPTTKATTQTILPFAGLKNPLGVAVDSAGNVYVVDSGNNRVLKLGSDFTKG